jgi:hypothetical protein
MTPPAPTENTGETLGNLIPWRAGHPSPNPGGRPKGLASLVREQTKDGQELVRFMLGVLRGRKAPLRLRMEAAAWLADRGFGKVSQPLTGEGGGPLRFTLVLSAAGAPVEEGADGDGGGGGG